MTPPAATTTPHARPTRRRPAQRPPRRVSGPARGARAAGDGVLRGGAVAAPPPLGLRVARAGGRIVDARFLDRLLRGRVWIGLLAVGLMGIVFIQVSMLRLNAGISRAITSAETLSHQNALMRADISKLDSGERIADSAGALGMIQPAAGSVNYLDARKADARAAAQAIRPPRPLTGATGASPTATAGAAAQSTSTAAAQAQNETRAPATTTQAQAASAPPAATTAPSTSQGPATTEAATTQTPATTTAPPAATTSAPATTTAAAPPTTTATAPPGTTAVPQTAATGQGAQ